MKKQSIISKCTPILDNIHFIILFLIILSLSLCYNIFFLFLIIYTLFLIKKRILKKIGYLILIIFSLNLIINYYFIHINDSNVKCYAYVLDVSDSKIIIRDNFNLYVSYEKTNLKPGDYIYIEASNMELETSSYAGDFDEKFYFLSNHYNKKIDIKTYHKVFNIYSFKRIRFELLNYYKKIFNNETYDFVCSLTLGKSINIDSINKLNLSHILVISGFHLSFLYLLLDKLLFKCTHNLYLSKIINLTIITIYSLISGASLSILRALIMIYLKEVNERYQMFNKLDMFSITFLILIIRPLNIYNISFILSNIASFSLIYINELLSKIKYKKIYMNVLLFLILLPITTNFNNRFSLFFVFSFLFFDYFSYCLIPFSFFMLFFPKFNYLYELILNPFLNLISVLSKCFLITIPYMNIYIKLIYYLILLLVILNRQKIFKIIFILLLFLFSNYHSLINEEVVFIDVKQGDSAYIKSGDKSYLIDCHNCYNYLSRVGIKHINYIFISHDDYDHMSDLDKILENIEVDVLYTNKYDNKVSFICAKHNVDFKKLEYKDVLNINNDRIEVISPKKNYNESNLNSLVLKVNHNNKNYLFTGDMCELNEFELLNYNIGKIDYLKVAHHGSNTSSSLAFLNKIKPLYSIVSVAKYNKYNLPSDYVINNLKRISKVYITSKNGNIIIRNNVLKTYK